MPERVVETVNGQQTTVGWQYDDLNRLTGEDYNAPGETHDHNYSYTYDIVSNLIEHQIEGGESKYYFYDPNNDELDRMRVGDVNTFYYYDNNGSLVREANDTSLIREYGYNLRNRLAWTDDGSTVTNYSYDPSGVVVGRGLSGGYKADYLIDPYNHTGYSQILKAQVNGDVNTVYISGLDVIGQAKGSQPIGYFVYDSHGSVRQLTDSSGAIIESYNFDAYGNAVGFNPAMALTNLLYCGEFCDASMTQYYLRARWYSPQTTRFNRLDAYRGNIFEPESLHKYLYAHANPIAGSDPTGLVFWTPYHGIIVHQKIGRHFEKSSSNDRLSDRTINTILRTKVELWGLNRPDLTDRTTCEVYEIKPVGMLTVGQAQLGWYLLLLNSFDPLKRFWTPGITYFPPSVVDINPLSIALVAPPVAGVIQYEIVDLPTIIAGVMAYQFAEFAAHIEMIKLRMSFARVPL